jgi:hypothetical protein
MVSSSCIASFANETVRVARHDDLNEKAAHPAPSFKSKTGRDRRIGLLDNPQEQFMPTFTDLIQPHVREEINAAAVAEARGEFDTAFRKLERAHVLGQSSTREHVHVHWEMLRFAIRNRLKGEAIGQAWRLVAAAIFTPLGVVPAGNTGGADVNGFKPMRMARDLQATIDAARA